MRLSPHMCVVFTLLVCVVLALHKRYVVLTQTSILWYKRGKDPQPEGIADLPPGAEVQVTHIDTTRPAPHKQPAQTFVDIDSRLTCVCAVGQR